MPDEPTAVIPHGGVSEEREGQPSRLLGSWWTLIAFAFSHNAVVQRCKRFYSLISQIVSACFAAIGISLLYGTVREVKLQLGPGDE